MIEHIIVLYVVIRLIKGLLVESRGKTGLISYIIKSVIRASKKIGFIQRRIDKELSAEAKKTVGKMLEEKTIKPSYGSIPESPVSHSSLL